MDEAITMKQLHEMPGRERLQPSRPHTAYELVVGVESYATVRLPNMYLW
jgi:hypothetical protein